MRFASALIALDLPAFERPANAISGGPGAGSCARDATPVTNVAPTSTCGVRGIGRPRFGAIARVRYNGVLFHGDGEFRRHGRSIEE